MILRHSVCNTVVTPQIHSALNFLAGKIRNGVHVQSLPVKDWESLPNFKISDCNFLCFDVRQQFNDAQCWKNIISCFIIFSGHEQKLLKMYLPSRYSTLGLACHSSPFNYDDSTRSNSNFQNNGKVMSCSQLTLKGLPVKSHFKASRLYNIIRGFGQHL